MQFGKFVPIVLFVVAVVLAVFLVLQLNPDRDATHKNGYKPTIESSPAGTDDYTAPPKKDFLQRCDPLVIDAWRQLDGLHSQFFDKYNTADRDEQLKMQDELRALFSEYKPLGEGIKPPGNEDDDTLAERARKGIWRVGYKFEKAIEQNPDNPCNYVSYAVFLKSRNEALAYRNFKKGIELWPSNYGFYWLLADFLYRTPSSHGFTVFNVVHPQERLREFSDEMFELLDQAQKYDPDNSFERIYRAQIMISLGEDAVDIFREFKAASKLGTYPEFIQPPPRPAKTLNWLNAANIVTKSLNLHYDIESNYGFYMNGVIERYISRGGLLEAAEREGPDVFPVMFKVIFRMGATDPFDRSFFYLAPLITDVMKKYYTLHENDDAVLALETLYSSSRAIERRIRDTATTSKDWQTRLPEGVDPWDEKVLPLQELEMLLRRNNPTLRRMVEKFGPRLVRECGEIVDEYPVEPDPTAVGKYWKPDSLIEEALAEYKRRMSGDDGKEASQDPNG